MKKSASRVLMFVENLYPQDIRIKNEADMLTQAGHSVTVVAFQKPGQPRTEVIEGVRVYRFPQLELFQKTPSENPALLLRIWSKMQAFLGYFSEYLYFTSACFVLAVYVAVKHGFDVIHAHNPPDTLFLVALPFKLVGKAFVYDVHDLSPELYMSRYGAEKGVVTRLLGLAEWCSVKS